VRRNHDLKKCIELVSLIFGIARPEQFQWGLTRENVYCLPNAYSRGDSCIAN
jgi:hypothetical protein